MNVHSCVPKKQVEIFYLRKKGSESDLAYGLQFANPCSLYTIIIFFFFYWIHLSDEQNHNMMKTFYEYMLLVRHMKCLGAQKIKRKKSIYALSK